jgi:nitrite reductase/ring-hydroxylating ferredoxin subunit
MNESIQTPVTPAITENAAVAFCCNAYAEAHQAALANGKGPVFATLDAYAAYRAAMPALSGEQNIRDFVACTAHGMLIDAIDGSVGARLLYAAQVAHRTLHKSPPKPEPK